MKYYRKTIDRRDVNLLLICLTITSMFSIRYALQNMAAKATEILSPLPDKFEYTVARDVVIVEKPVYKLPQEDKDILESVFGDLAKEAEQIVMCESGGRAKAFNQNTNGSVDVGWFQINSVHGVSKRFLEDKLINALVAKEIYDGRGNWSAWVCAGKLGL